MLHTPLASDIRVSMIRHVHVPRYSFGPLVGLYRRHNNSFENTGLLHSVRQDNGPCNQDAGNFR